MEITSFCEKRNESVPAASNSTMWSHFSFFFYSLLSLLSGAKPHMPCGQRMASGHDNSFYLCWMPVQNPAKHRFFSKAVVLKKKTYFVSSISSIRFPFASNYILLYVKWVKKKSCWAPLVHIVSPRNTKFTCLLSFWDFSLFRMDFTLYSHFSCLLCKSHFFFHRTIVECSHFLWLSFSKMNSMICV